MLVAIQPDHYPHLDSVEAYHFSHWRWTDLLRQAGHAVRSVNLYHADALPQLAGCDAFMWRWGHQFGIERVARRLLPIIERDMGLIVYPDQNTCWHYDDKLIQAYLLEVLGIPIPKTWVWFDRDAALRWVKTATYPLVLKLYAGASSTNVRLVHGVAEAERWIGALFGPGVHQLSDDTFRRTGNWGWKQRLRAAAKALLKGRPLTQPIPEGPLHRDYVLFQEFLPDNPYDTRITVIGNRAFGFRRWNRPNDFRASGSGRLDYDVAAVDLRFVRLAFRTAARVRAQSCAIDGMYRDGEPVVGEISYTYVSRAISHCAGHWELQGDPETGHLAWREGAMWPEEAQIADFLQRLATPRRWPQAA